MQANTTKYLHPHEVFKLIENTKSFHDRVAILQKNATFSIKTILQCNFNPIIKLDLPEGVPPFNKDGMPVGNSLGRIDKAIKILGKIAIVGKELPAVGIERIKKEKYFIQLLESINEKDADIMIMIKDKKLTKLYPTITEALAKNAFPELF